MIIFQYNYEALYAFLYSKNITPKIYLSSYCQNLKYQQIQHRKFYTHTQIFSHMDWDGGRERACKECHLNRLFHFKTQKYK